MLIAHMESLPHFFSYFCFWFCFVWFSDRTSGILTLVQFLESFPLFHMVLNRSPLRSQMAVLIPSDQWGKGLRENRELGYSHVSWQGAALHLRALFCAAITFEISLSWQAVFKCKLFSPELSFAKKFVMHSILENLKREDPHYRKSKISHRNVRSKRSICDIHYNLKCLYHDYFPGVDCHNYFF